MANEVLAAHAPIAVSVTCTHPPGNPGPSGLSPLAAKILDQLSVTAWLPAALLMANTYLLAGMHLVREPGSDPTTANLEDVVKAIDSKAIGVLLAVVLGIVLATLFTQSLEYAAIRFLEGYWGGSVYAAIPTKVGVWVQQRRQYLMARRVEKLDRRAFELAQDEIRETLRREDPAFVDAAVAAGLGRSLPPGLTQEQHKRAEGYFDKKTLWRPMAPAHLRHRALSLEVKAAAFPQDDSRLLPTRLGCALRSSEDKLSGDVTGAKMRSYLYERLDKIGPALMEQHNQYRNRLDMCSVLTVLCLLLATADALLLPALLPAEYVVSTCLGLVGLSYLSYRGAVAAALDYGPILVAINKKVEEAALS
jgi:hypothetical protein